MNKSLLPEGLGKKLIFILLFYFVALLLYPLHNVIGQAGSLDCTFGSGGVVTTPFVSDKENVSYDLAFYESGTHSDKMVVVGNADDASGLSDFAIVRYNADGSIDTDFGTQGKVIIDFGQDGERALGVAIQSDDKIVVTGNSGNPSYCAIARLNADGTLDTGFDTDGKNRVVAGYWGDVAIDGSGNIWVAGSTTNRSTILKFSSSGSHLNTFEYDLTSGSTCCESFGGIAVDGSGNIVAVGGAQGTTRDMSIIRINSSGTLDTGFDSDGKMLIDFGSDWDVAGSVAISASGQIAISGEANDGDMGVALLNSDGSFDTGFSADGKAVVDLDGGTSDQSGGGVAFQSDGKIIAGCYAGGQYGVARFNTDGSLDTSFDTDGKVVYTTGVIGGDYPYNFVLSPDDKFVGVGIAWVESGDDGKDFGILSVRTTSEDMIYGSASCAQDTSIVEQGKEDHFLQIVVETCGDLNAYSLTGISIDTYGTTDPGDIDSAKIYYTGNSNEFATTTQFGTLVTNPNGTTNFSGSQALLHGTNYFWVAYKVKEDATLGNVIDAKCHSITIDGGIGTVTPSNNEPAGGRTIKVVAFSEDFGVDADPLPNGWTIQDIDTDGHNWTKTIEPYASTPNGRTGGGLRSASWDENGLAPVDNRLITPAIDLSSYTEASLSFFVRALDDWYPEELEVLISTSWNGTDDFPTTVQLDSFTVDFMDWQQKLINLDSYVGETVYLSWRHTASAEQWAILLDDIIIEAIEAGSPDIEIAYMGNIIADGDNSPSEADGTDYGDTVTVNGKVIRTFYVKNTGSVGLNLTGDPKAELSGSHASDFEILNQPFSYVGVSDSVSMQIAFDPTALGLRTATISIESDDSDESPYTFALAGSGVKDTARIIAPPNASNIAYGDSVGESALGGGTMSTLGSFSFADSGYYPPAGPQIVTVNLIPDDLDNFISTSTEIMLGVEKAVVVTTVDNKSKTYGDDNPELTFQYGTFLFDDNADSIDVDPTVGTAATSSSPAGFYDIDLSDGSDNNYNFYFLDGTLAINKAELNVVARDTSKIYGSSNPPLKLDLSGWIGTDNIDSLEQAPDADVNANSASSAGEYDIIASGGDDNNYTFNYTNATLTINKAKLTVTAQDTSKNYGEPNPPFNVAYIGFLGADNLMSLDAVPYPMTTADENSVPGEYDITLTGGSDNNYDFIYVNGTLTVKQGGEVNSITASGIKMYPNPTSDLITISSKNNIEIDCKLITTAGELLEEAKGRQIKLSLQSYPSGTYLLIINEQSYPIIKD